MRSIKNKILIAALVLIGSVAAANAQISGPLGVKFRTSFPFMVGNTTMPRGQLRSETAWIRQLPLLTDTAGTGRTGNA